MVCPILNSENPELLLDYCARRLDAHTSAELSRHMAQCPECRQFAEAQESVWKALDAWDAQPVSDTFDQRLYARISAEERRGFWSRLLGDRVHWKPAVSFAAACATVALAILINVPGSSPVPAPQTDTPFVQALEPEQIDRSIEDFEMLRQFSSPGQNQAL